MTFQQELDEAAPAAIDWRAVVHVAMVLPRLVDDLPDSATRGELVLEARRLKAAISRPFTVSWSGAGVAAVGCSAGVSGAHWGGTAPRIGEPGRRRSTHGSSRTCTPRTCTTRQRRPLSSLTASPSSGIVAEYRSTEASGKTNVKSGIPPHCSSGTPGRNPLSATVEHRERLLSSGDGSTVGLSVNSSTLRCGSYDATRLGDPEPASAIAVLAPGRGSLRRCAR